MRHLILLVLAAMALSNCDAVKLYYKNKFTTNKATFQLQKGTRS